MKAKKFYVSPSVKEDDLLVGLSTWKNWGIAGEEFPKPHTNSFFASDDCMILIKLKIASFVGKKIRNRLCKF